MDVIYRRPDGTFVAIVDGLPYHVIDSDPLYTQAQIDGASAPFEPDPEPQPEPTLQEERAAMSATRGQFLIAAVGAGIITEATAEEAAGGVWPAAFDTFMAGLSAPQRIAAKSAWVDGDKVRRTNPILALIAADQSVSPEAVDDLFRAAMEIDL